MMGKYFDWQPWVKRSRKKKTPEQLRRYLYKNGFLYTVNIADMYAIGDSIIYHPEITDLTSDEWTGYFLSHGKLKKMRWQLNWCGDEIRFSIFV